MVLFTRASSLQHSQSRHHVASTWNVFRSAGVFRLSYPGFHHLQCPEDPSPEQIVRSSVLLMPVPTESRTYAMFPRRDVSDPAQRVCCHSAGSGSQFTGNPAELQGNRAVHGSQFTVHGSEIRISVARALREVRRCGACIDYSRCDMAVNFRELEENLTRMDSVDAARVVNQGATITELHVIAPADKPAKQVVRDIQSLAMARFGVAIDHRVISVVQISPHQLDIASGARAALMRIGESPNGTRTTIEVTLRHDDEEHVGSATGPAVISARHRLVGEATINAIEQTFPTMPPIALDAISVTPVGQNDVVVAVVVSAGQRGSEDLNVGSAIVAIDLDDAAVKAVLNALNRRLGNLEE